MHIIKPLILIAMMVAIPIRDATAVEDEPMTMDKWFEFSTEQKAAMYYEFLKDTNPEPDQIAVFYCPSGGGFAMTAEEVKAVKEMDYDGAISLLVVAITGACKGDVESQHGF